MSMTYHAIVTCIEYLRGIAAQAREDGKTDDARLLEQVADGIWREKMRLAREAVSAFGAEVDGRPK